MSGNPPPSRVRLWKQLSRRHLLLRLLWSQLSRPALRHPRKNPRRFLARPKSKTYPPIPAQLRLRPRSRNPLSRLLRPRLPLRAPRLPAIRILRKRLRLSQLRALGRARSRKPLLHPAPDRRRRLPLPARALSCHQSPLPVPAPGRRRKLQVKTRNPLKRLRRRRHPSLRPDLRPRKPSQALIPPPMRLPQSPPPIMCLRQLLSSNCPRLTP